MDTSTATHAVSQSVSTTDSWIYLFSKFTHEAMLFQALAICLGIFGYAIFYLIQKRKYGVAGKEIESGIVKVYLAQLVADAEEMRTQLFGLLGKGEATGKLLAGLQFQADQFAGTSAEGTASTGATAAGTPLVSTQVVQDPKLQDKLKELEKKLAEQASALDSVLNEKMKLEEELAGAKDEAKGGTPGAPDKSGPLQERVKQLESQLAEYAIIEDDLANLKRLQKENKTLKQTLAEVTGGAPIPAAKPAADEAPNLDAKPAAAETPNLDAKPAATPDAPNLDAQPAAVDAPNLDAKPATPEAPNLDTKGATPEAPNLDPKAAKPAPTEVAPTTETPTLDAAAPTTESATPTLEAAPTKNDVVAPDLSGPAGSDIATEEVAKASGSSEPTADFESLVDVVEKNLAEAAKSENVNTTDTPAADLNLDAGAKDDRNEKSEKSEEQLQADFEKMLNS
jgi:hypothetical protein